MARTDCGSSQSPRARRGSTQDPLDHHKGDVQKTAGNFDYDQAGEIIQEHSETYSPKYEADGYAPRKSA
jgi:hypothetical protein